MLYDILFGNIVILEKKMATGLCLLFFGWFRAEDVRI